MRISYAPAFTKMLKRLEPRIRKFFFAQETILRRNWRDSRLHLKKLKGRSITFSFRITRNYRALFYFKTPEEIVLYAIGNRKDIYH